MSKKPLILVTNDDGITLHLDEISKKGAKTKMYSCSGTPADCVKIAINEILDRKPDLCVSGVNHGSNSSINVIYSGTMSAAKKYVKKWLARRRYFKC